MISGAPQGDLLPKIGDATSAQRQLKTLTSLRFAAATLIVVHHSRGKFGLPPDMLEPFALDQGVAFFFVLSGFILTYVYPSLRGVGARRFLLARVARIWPAHVGALLLVLLLCPPGSGMDFFKAAANLSMVHAWIPSADYFFSFNAPSWSISTECGFYLSFPFLIYAFESTWSVKLLLAFLLVAAVVTLSNASHLPVETGRGVAQLGVIYVSPLGRLFEFTLGMVTALVFRRLQRAPYIRLVPATLLEFAVVGLAGFSMYITHRVAGSAEQYAWIGSPGALWLAKGGIPCVPFALLILVMALERGLISRLLCLSFPVFLGEISYSVYLVHLTLIEYYWSHLRNCSLFPGWVAYLVFWAALLLTAHLMYSLVERPCRRFLVGLWAKESVPDSIVLRRRPGGDRAVPFTRMRHALVWPRRWWLASEVLFSVLLAMLIVYVASNPLSLRLMDQNDAEQLISRSVSEARGVRFGDQFALLGLEMKRTAMGLTLELGWQSLADQRLEWRVLVHLVDGAGSILSQADYQLDTARSNVRAGTMWRDVIELPLFREVHGSRENLDGASALAIGLYQSEGALVADRGPRDWNGHRLVLPLPRTPPVVQ